MSLKGYEIGFGTLKNSVPGNFASLWEKTKPQWRQVHGTDYCEVSRLGQECGQVDALFTVKNALPVAVVTADCVPILLAGIDRPFASAIHAGWKGIRKQIASRLVRELQSSLKLDPKKIKAWIGPAVGPCCYEVSPEMIDDFTLFFSHFSHDLIIPKKRHLDLQRIQELELSHLGITDIEVIRECTKCTIDSESKSWKYASYRRDGTGTRQYSMIHIAQPE